MSLNNKALTNPVIILDISVIPDHKQLTGTKILPISYFKDRIAYDVLIYKFMNTAFFSYFSNAVCCNGDCKVPL